MGPEDRETAIAFTDADETMQIVTANRKLKGRLKKLGFESSGTEDGHDFFEVPKEFLQLRKPRDLSLSEDEKEERRERLREVRKAAGIDEFRAGGTKAKKKAKPTTKKRRPAPEPEDEGDDEDVDIYDMSIGQLRSYAKSQGVSGAGTKKDIIARLEGEDEEDEEDYEDAEDADTDEAEDFEDDEEETEVVKPRARKTKSRSTRKPTARKKR